MPRIPLPFVGGAYTGKRKSLNGQRCVNCFPVVDKQDGKSVLSLDGIPGNVEYLDLGTASEVRGLWTANDSLYAVSDGHLYEINTTPAATDEGAVGAGTGPVGFANDATYMFIADPAAGTSYLYTFATDALVASDLAATPTGQVGFLDTYILVAQADSEIFWWCDVGDPSTWTGTNYSSADAKADELVTIFILDRQIWMFGVDGIEVWYNDGSTPFSRIPGSFMATGCGAADSVASYVDTVFWLSGGRQGQRQVLVADQNYQPQPISTSQIDYQLSTYSTVSDAIGVCYEQEGHPFYVITFPTEGKTWAYDISTGYWHERERWIDATSTAWRWRANCYAYFDGKHLIGDYDNGKIYELDMTDYQDDCETLRWIRETQYAHNKRLKVRMDALDLDFNFGETVLAVGDGSDPVVSLQISVNGGQNYGNSRLRSLGKIGEFGNDAMRARWRRLGSRRTRTFRATITDPIPRSLIAAHADIQLVER